MLPENIDFLLSNKVTIIIVFLVVTAQLKIRLTTKDLGYSIIGESNQSKIPLLN